MDASPLLRILDRNRMKHGLVILALGGREQFLARVSGVTNPHFRFERTRRRMLLMAVFSSFFERPGMAASICTTFMACGTGQHD